LEAVAENSAGVDAIYLFLSFLGSLLSQDAWQKRACARRVPGEDAALARRRAATA
jgi:hypothetical protein